MRRLKNLFPSLPKHQYNARTKIRPFVYSPHTNSSSLDSKTVASRTARVERAARLATESGCALTCPQQEASPAGTSSLSVIKPQLRDVHRTDRQHASTAKRVEEVRVRLSTGEGKILDRPSWHVWGCIECRAEQSQPLSAVMMRACVPACGVACGPPGN